MSPPSSPPAALRLLPPPDADARAHSERVAAHLRSVIREAGGHLPFVRFMEEALYAPGLGYYSAGSRKFGAAGDFITAPELSPLFSRTLARYCARFLHREGGALLECGAGSGEMAVELLLELERLEALPDRYLILEVSGELRARQVATLERRAPHLLARVEWLERPPSAFHGVVLANELLDAMPVDLLVWDGAAVHERCVTVEGAGFAWSERRPVDAALEAQVRALAEECALPAGYCIEIQRQAAAWVRELGRWLAHGVALLIDYGEPRRAFYHPQRKDGTLRCHYRHRAHDEPLILPGLQDITAHVEFTAMAEAALEGGLAVCGFATQAGFLLANGIAEMAVADTPRERYRRAEEVKRLTHPGEMGERFKVMAVGRGVALPLQGFALRDERGRL